MPARKSPTLFVILNGKKIENSDFRGAISQLREQGCQVRRRICLVGVTLCLCMQCCTAPAAVINQNTLTAT